jgi:hypothetical protein
MEANMPTLNKDSAKSNKEQTLGQQLNNNTPHIEGNKGFNFAKPVTGVSGKIDFTIALERNQPIPSYVPRQIALVMEEWHAQGGGLVEIQAINDSLETKRLWKRANGASYNQDVATILLHYRAMLLGTANWGKRGDKLKLATFGS